MSPILVSASYDATIRFWDLNRGTSVTSIAHKDSQVNALELSSDRSLLALGCWQSLKLVDVGKQQIVVSTECARNVTSLYYIPESTRLISGGEDQRIRLWNTRSGQMHTEKIFELPATVNSVCVHPNQTTIIASDGQGGVYQWDTRTWKHQQVAVNGMNYGEHIISIAASAYGNLVAGATNQGRLFTWNVSEGNIDVKSEGAVTSNNRLVGPLNLGDQKTIQAHRDFITRVRFTPNGERLATTSADGSVCLWDPRNLESEKPLTRFVDDSKPQKVPTGWVWDCAFTETAKSKYMISASTDGILRLWDVPSGRVKMHFLGHNKAITAMAFRDAF